MNIRESRKWNFKVPTGSFNNVIFGSKDASLTIAGTIGAWVVGFILAIVIFYMNNSNGQEVLSSYILNTEIIFSASISVICILFIVGASDFGQNGWPIWRRIIISNIILLISLMYISTMDQTEVREPATRLEFVSTDVKDCKYSVRMVSKNLKYTFCTDYDSEYEKLAKANKESIILVSNSKTESRANHYEYLELSK